MAKFIVIGFPSNDKTVAGKVCYAGNDGSKAEAALFKPEEGILRKGIIRHPVYSKTRHFDPAPAEEAPDTPAEETPAPAEETDQPGSGEPEGLGKIIGRGAKK